MEAPYTPHPGFSFQKKDSMKFMKTYLYEMLKDLCIKKCFLKSSKENYKGYSDTGSTSKN